MVPMLMAIGFLGFVRLLRWTGAWVAHGPPEPHWHLGPVAVDAHLQGKGIGRALIAEYCARLDRANAVGYLETDKTENVKFYRRFGFRNDHRSAGFEHAELVHAATRGRTGSE